MILRGSFFVLLVFFWSGFALPAHAREGNFTLWPLIDYRASEQLDYRSLHILGPIFKYEIKATETEYAIRPLFYRAVDDQGISKTDILYPLSSRKNDDENTSFQFLGLFSTDSSDSEYGHDRKFYLFPFLFYGDHAEHGKYFAVFPIGGKLHGWFKRDTIIFTLFPLYSQTHRQSTRVDNYLWPFFAKISGENESGFKAWPLYGQSQKEGHYRKRFFLWPFFFSYSLDLNTENPIEKRAFFPFYYSRMSPAESYQATLWPFFSKRVDHKKDYRDWYAPWPLIRFIRGENHYGNRFLPFYADETMAANRRRWYLWPIYKIEQMQTELIMRRRDRILFFLYSDLKEVGYETGRQKRRIALWPFFNYQSINGVSHFSTLALAEPFFPENEGIERSWAPLWRFYQQKWDRHGNHVISLLWNFYWREQRGEDVAWELFPLVEYSNETEKGTDFRLLKGLIRYRSNQDKSQLNLFYLPWGFGWNHD